MVSAEPAVFYDSVKRVLSKTNTIIALTLSGESFVVKLSPHLTLPNALANEVIGSELMSALGIPTPRWRSVLLSANDIKKVRGTQALSGHPTAGLHFGSEYLDHPDFMIRDQKWYSAHALTNYHINRQSFLDVFLFDIWTNNVGERQWIDRVHNHTKCTTSYFIDNTRLFADGTWGVEGARPVTHRLQRDMYGWLYPRSSGVIKDAVIKMQENGRAALVYAIKEVPPKWLRGDVNQLKDWLFDRLNDLHGLVENNIPDEQTRGCPDAATFFFDHPSGTKGNSSTPTQAPSSPFANSEKHALPEDIHAV